MSAKKRPRQKEKEEEDGVAAGSWECTVCTFRNRYEAFKCEMCDTRKGTSTRKPRLNQDVQQMHSAVHNFVLQQHQRLPSSRRNKPQVSVDSPSTSRQSPESTSSGPVQKREQVAVNSHVKRRRPVPLADHLIYRSSPRKMTVTVRGVSAVITEFRPRHVST